MSMPYVYSIKDEADILTKLSSDLDNFRRFYSLKEENVNETILVRFVAPQISAYEDYRFYLLKNSVKKPLAPNRYYRPDYVSYDEYDTINYWALLLFLNDIPTIEDFEVEEIYVPTPASLIEISNDILYKDLLHEIVPLTDLPPKPTSPLYSRVQVKPKYVIPTKSTVPFVPSSLYYNRESFTIDVVLARQRYVDLQFEPVPNSLDLKVQDSPNFIYGKHYIMIRGNKGNNRLTWDSRLINNGVGLNSVLVEGVQFEISYARKVPITS
jgi:hypothetical protein